MKSSRALQLITVLTVALALQGCSRAALRAMGLNQPAPPLGRASSATPAPAPPPAPTQSAVVTPPPAPAAARTPPGLAPPPLAAPRSTVEAVATTKPAAPSPTPSSSAVAAPAKPAPNPAGSAVGLDLAGFRERIESSPGLGPLTKRAMANELDDFLAVVAASKAEPTSPATQATLRDRYNKLVVKFGAILRDRDAELARRLSASRASLWASLDDARQAASLP